MNKRLFSMFLALCMIVTMLPVSAMAEEIHTTIGGSGEIISFAPLTETAKAVSLGTSIEDLELPETLTATVRTAVPADEDSTQDSGSPETATPTTAAEPKWKETTGDIPVEWASPDYDMDTEGAYVFTPVIADYTVSAPLPELTVTVDETLPIAAAQGMASPLPATTYNIWVGGVQVTDANKDDVLDAANYEGATITYDPDTSTLTLDNATINAAHNGTWIDSATTAYYGIYAETALKIEMVGSNTVIGKSQSGSASIGIYTGGTLNLSGSGSLYVSGGTGKFSVGIYSTGSIAIEGGRVTAASVAATQTSMAIASNGDITISNEGVEASADTSAPNSYGMIATNGFAINNGEVTASGKTGLHTNAAEGPVTVSDGRLTANGSLVGIAGALTVTGGTVTVKSDTKALDGSLATSGYTGCTVTAGANKNGDGAGTYNASSLASYKYIKVEPAATPPVILIADRTALQSAIDGATGDLNLKLSDSYSGTGMVKIPDSWDYNITIDLNGKTLDGNYDNAILHGGSGVLSITDSKGGGMVTSKTSTGTIRANDGSKVNILGGTVSATGSNGYAIFSANAILNISGGTVSATGGNGYAIFSTNTYAQLNISGGTISAVNGTAIYFTNTTISTGGTVVIQGGTKAMVFKPLLSKDLQSEASTDYSGSDSVDYNEANIATYKYLKFGLDIIPPVLSSGNVNRASDTAATVGFTTDKVGTAYYLVVNSGASAPTSAAVKAGTSLGSVSGTVTGKAVTLTAGAKDIYVVVEYSAGNISTPLKIEAAAYVAPDTTAPKVTSVSVPPEGDYSNGHTLDFTVNFDENVTVDTTNGTPYIALTVGSMTKQTVYVSGSGTQNLVFRYTVNVGDSDSDGVSIGSLILNGGTIEDEAGNNANLTLNDVNSTTGIRVNPLVAPSITGQPSPQTVNEGQSATFSVTAAGTGLTYQWQVNTGYSFINISNGGVYSGAATTTLTITGVTAGMNGYQYRAVVSGTVLPAATSNSATLTVTDTRTELTSVFISDTTPTFGDILSATINPSTATVTYSWKADGSQVGTSATYEVKAADIGKTITLTVTGTGAYKGTVTSSVTSAVAAKDYSVTVDSTKSVVQGSGLSALPTANAGAVNGTLIWYSDSGLTKAVTDQNVRALVVDSVVTVYWSFTPTTAGYVTTPKTGECVVTIVSGAAQTLSFAESTVTKTVGDPIFTNALTHSVGTGMVIYSSSNTSVATVHPTTGEVAIVGAGNTTITANAAMVPGVYAPGSASFTLTVNNAPIKTVSVGSQSGTATAGTAGSLTYAVTTANITNGIYTVSVANLPAGVTIGNSGNVTISDNSGTLTLTVADTAAAGTTGTLVLTLNSATSAEFSIVIGEPAPTTTYTITADPVTKDFGSLTIGYTAPAAQTVTITNTGNSSVTLTQPTSTNYTIGTLSTTTLAANGTATFTVAPKAGLAVGNYNETLTVSTNQSTNATVELSFSVTAVPNYTVTFNPNGGTVGETTRSVASGTAVGTLPTPTRSGSYSFDGWYTAVSGGTQISASTTVSANVTYYAHWTYTGGGGSGSGGGSSLNDNSSPVIVTPPAPDKPNSPTQGEIKVSGTVDSKGNVTVNISDKTVIDAFEKALADAKKNGNEQNGITVILRVDTGSKIGSHVTVNLPKTVQDTIIEKKIVNTIVVVDNPDIRIGMDLATVQEINKQAKSDVNITATRGDSSKLTGDAKKAIGSRSVFDLKVNYGNGKAVSSFGAGSVSVTIPYTLGANEKAGNVQAVYVDSKGKVHWLTNSVYDSVAQVLRFSTDHFSTYGIGYKQANTAFTDIAAHWAKEDIEFVVSRGLFSGTSNTTFSPNTAMTRGMFVTALGRLANADVSGYAKSSFTDVKNDTYYMGYIEWASKNNIVNGVGNGRFAPDQSITREQMAVIMSNYAKTIGYNLPKVYIENIFIDNAKISTYTKETVKQMQMAGVISGKNGNLFDPQGTATRAEVSAVLRRFVELAISSDTAQGWSMNDSGKWMYFKDGKPLTGKQDIDGATYTFDQYGVTVDMPKNLRYTTYTVQKGDSFWSISRKLGCPMSELERLNNKSRFSLIFPGDVLRVPEK